MRLRIVWICIPLFVSEIVVSVGTTILSEMTRDASVAVPCVWKLPDLWTQRTRPQVFAKPQTVSHSSHTPHHRVPSEARRTPEPPESLISDPQILRRRRDVIASHRLPRVYWSSMRFEKIWVEQCRATKGSKRRFGAK